MKMFKTLGLLGVLATGSLVEASEHSHLLRVTVPFSFVVAGQRFQPGEYFVTENANGVITVQGAGKAAAVLSIPMTAPKEGQTSALRFIDNAERDLVSVAMEGEGTRGVPVRAVEQPKMIVSANHGQ